MQVKCRTLVLALGLVHLCMISAAASQPSLYKDTLHYRLYDELFHGYNTKLRPRVSPSEPVFVRLDYELNSITGLDAVNQVMKFVGFVIATWRDDFMTWNATEYGIENIVVPANSVWLPDLGVKNSADGFYNIAFTRDFRVDIRYDGRVLWAFGGNFATMCTLDMTFFPFDLQTCAIDIENWVYTNDSVHIFNHVTEVHLQDFSENGEWELDHSSAKVEYFTEDAFQGKYFPRVRFVLFLSRKYRYYIINIICPALFVIAVSLSVFWLPPDCGEKVAVGITVLLAFFVFQLVIMENSPQTSDFIPVLTMLFTCSMGMSTFSVLTSIAVLYFHHHGPEKRPPKLVRVIAFKFIARVFFMTGNVPQKQKISEKQSKVFNYDVKQLVNTVNEFHGFDIESTTKKNSSLDESRIKEILQQIRELVSRSEDEERKAMIMAEWKSIAQLLDRAFFWISFVTLSVLVPFFLLRRDNSHNYS